MRGVARIPSPNEWILTRTCTRCGETKPWAKFPPRRYWPDGTVRVVASHCSACDSKMTRARHLKWREERSEQWVRYERNRAAWQRRKRRAIAADRAGALNSYRLPVQPIREFLLREMNSGVGMVELADRCQVSQRALYRLLHEHDHVSLRLADMIATRLGVHLNDLYPDDLETAA